jgi:hypothetical protein
MVPLQSPMSIRRTIPALGNSGQRNGGCSRREMPAVHLGHAAVSAAGRDVSSGRRHAASLICPAIGSVPASCSSIVQQAVPLNLAIPLPSRYAVSEAFPAQ